MSSGIDVRDADCNVLKLLLKIDMPTRYVEYMDVMIGRVDSEKTCNAKVVFHGST